MKQFEFVTSKYPAAHVDKYLSSISTYLDKDCEIVLYPEMTFDCPVRPLSRNEISSRMSAVINDVVNNNNKYSRVLVVSYSEVVYRDFFYMLRSHEVPQFNLHLVGENGDSNVHVIKFNASRYRHLYKEITSYYLP